ncbi:MAG: adenylate/guanylate cyclase domain-containing protein [Elusimicrobiota bacterium]
MPKTMELSEFLTEETKALLDFIYDGVYVVDTERRILFWSRGAELVTGHLADEVVGKCCRDNILNHIDEGGKLLCLDDCPLTVCMRERRREERKIFPLHRSGHRVPTMTHVAPIKDKAGGVIGAIEVFRDISAEEKYNILQRKFEKLIAQYVSKKTYESVLDAASKDGVSTAAMKDLSVLFMDIVGFTTLSEKRKPGEIVDILNQLFSVTAHIIHQHTGDIDKFIGDCVMAVFIDAQDAVDAAKDILASGLPGLNKALRDKGFSPVQVRIGINSGQVLQGDIGSESRKDMTVIGDVVNTASRVEGAADPGGFLVSESAFSRLRKPEEFEFAKEIPLKGKSAPVRLFRLRSGHAS